MDIFGLKYHYTTNLQLRGAVTSKGKGSHISPVGPNKLTNSVPPLPKLNPSDQVELGDKEKIKYHDIF